MRSVDRPLPPATLRPAALLLACALLGGCASVVDTLQATRDKAVALVAPKESAAAPAAPAVPPPAPAASAAPVPAVAQALAEPEAPVPADAQRAYDEALRLLRAGRSDEAERALRALAQSQPRLGGPHANLGLIHRQAGRLEQAVASFEAAVQASPRQPVFHNQLGVSLRQAGQFAKARAAYERAIELDASYAAPLLNLGILLDLYLGEPAAALPMYERYLALTPAGDAAVTKWVADLKNRKPRPDPKTGPLAAKDKP